MRVFSIFVHTIGSSVPNVSVQHFDDEAAARALARLLIAESPRRLLVEVREGDRLIFCIDCCGITWPPKPVMPRGANRSNSGGAPVLPG